MSDTCIHCDEIIHQDDDHGWVHSHGGSQFAQRCAHCGKLTAQHGTPKRCAHCRQPAIFHLDHVAEPKPVAKRGVDPAHAAALVGALRGKMIQPDAQALKHLARRRPRAPRWLG